MMQQGYKKPRTQPGKRRLTCAGSVPASPFTYICRAAFLIKDYLGKTSPITAACSNRSRDQSYVLVGHGELRARRGGPCAQSRPPGQEDQNRLSQEKGAHSQAHSGPRQLLPGLSPPPSLHRGCPHAAVQAKAPAASSRRPMPPSRKRPPGNSTATIPLQMHVEKLQWLFQLHPPGSLARQQNTMDSGPESQQ